MPPALSGMNLKQLIPSIKIAFFVTIAIVTAYTFVWQRMTLQNLSADIKRMEQKANALEKNRDYLRSDILYRSSLEQTKNKAAGELGLKDSKPSEIITIPDTLIQLARPVSQRKMLANNFRNDRHVSQNQSENHAEPDESGLNHEK